MKKLIGALFLIAIVITTFIIASDNDHIPNGWFASGSNNAEYEIGIDNSVVQNGNSCAYIKSISPKENEFGNLMQTINTENYYNYPVI